MKYKTNQEGYILILCLMIMVILSILGIATLRNSKVELQISGNDNLHKKTFYGAEGSAMLAIEILEQNLNCPVGFSGSEGSINTVTYGTDNDKSVDAYDFNDIRVYSWAPKDLALYLNEYPGTAANDCDITAIVDKPNMSFPISNIDGGEELAAGTELSNVYLGGVAGMLPGGAFEMNAGYEGKGKSSADGGSARYYDIVSVNKDARNAEAKVLIGWRHVVGTETECEY